MFYKLHLEAPLNLTSIKERDEFYLKHYADSIEYFNSYMQRSLKEDISLADIGSGGGFPGIVLAIYNPSWKVTLVESIAKKCRFLEEAASKLGLTNVEVINKRAENITDRKFDIITSRGVASVKDIINLTYNLAHGSTFWLLYKGERLDDELKQAKQLLNKRGLHFETIRASQPLTRTYCIISH